MNKSEFKFNYRLYRLKIYASRSFNEFNDALEASQFFRAIRINHEIPVSIKIYLYNRRKA